jgi:hypothetical protein
MAERLVSLYSLARDLGEHVDLLERLGRLAGIPVIRHRQGRRRVRVVADRDVPRVSLAVQLWHERLRPYGKDQRVPKSPA